MTASLRLANKAQMAASGPSGPSGQAVALLVGSDYRIDARMGAVALNGSPDPVPLTGSLLNPDESALQSIAYLTNEGSAGASLWTTPHTAAMVPTSTLSVRARFRAVGDPSGGATTDQAVMVRKETDGDPLTPIFDLAITDTGKIRWQANPSRGGDYGSGFDWLAENTIRGDFNFTTGALAVYSSPDRGETWTLVAEDTKSPATPSADAGVLAFQIGKSVAHWCEVHVDDALVARFDVDDATEGATTVVSSRSGETWTAGDDVDVVTVDRAVWYVVNSSRDDEFTIADSPAMNIGAGDFTVACVLEPSSLASGAADFRILFGKMNPATIGSTGVGWGLIDYGPLGGAGFALNNGSGLKHAIGGTAWTARTRHLLVATGARSGNLRMFIDDMATPVATTDISTATGTLTNADTTSFGPPDLALLGAAVKWGRVLSAGELALLPTVLGV